MPSDTVLSVANEYDDTFRLIQRIRRAAKELTFAAAKSRLLVQESQATLGSALFGARRSPIACMVQAPGGVSGAKFPIE